MGPVRHVCDVRPEDLGPYLLGNLEPERVGSVAAQIEDCPACAAEVRRLRPVVAAMSGATPPEEGEQPATIRASVLDQVLDTVRQEQRSGRTRNRRLALGAAAAVLVAAAGAGAVVVTSGSDDPDGEGTAQVALTGEGGVAATAVLDPREWGTAIEMEVSGLDPGKVYGAWLEAPDGERVGAGTFRPDEEGSARLVLSAALQVEESGAIGVSWIGGEQRVDVLRADLDDVG